MTQDQLKELEALNDRWANEHLETSSDYNDLMSSVMDLLPDVIQALKERDGLMANLDYSVNLAVAAATEKLTAERDALRFSLNTCVGAAGLGDSEELCGWIDEIKAERDAALRALKETKDAGLLLCEANEVLQLRIVERDKACTEMRQLLVESPKPWRATHGAAQQDREWFKRRDHALSTDCGKGYRHDDEWKPVVEALRFAARALPPHQMAHVLAKQALAHAEKLTEGK